MASFKHNATAPVLENGPNDEVIGGAVNVAQNVPTDKAKWDAKDGAEKGWSSVFLSCHGVMT